MPPPSPRRRPAVARSSLLGPAFLILPAALCCLLGRGASAAETSLLDPQYYNIAPCPCDLQPSVCDVGCCCDAGCSDSDKLLFTCAQGFYGGNTTVELYRRCASTDGANSPDYHPFTCVLIEDYNAYLGLYFPVQTAVQSLTAWEAKQLTAPLASRLRQFQPDTALGLTEAQPTAATQRMGLTVLQYPNGTSSGATNNYMANYRLALPRRTLGGGCDRTAGVLYLEDSSDACDVAATVDLCGAGVASALDVGTYATDCSAGAACESLVHTRSTFGAGGFAVQVSVTYWYLNTAGGYQKGVSGGRGAASVITRQAPSASGSTCNNSVVDVQYSFVWSGSTLVNMTAAVFLADVTINSVVTQRFSATFTHLSAGTATTKRSGVVGYEPGASLFGGDAPPSGNSSVNTSASYQPRLWRANAQSGGACDATSTGGDPVQFLVDATSYCTEAVPLADFSSVSNCTALSERLHAKLSGQFSAGVLGIFGGANSSIANDWVTVHRQSLVYYGAENVTNAANTSLAWTNLTGVCLGVPTEVVLTVLYAEQGKANDSSIWQVVGAYLRYKYVHLTAVCSLGGNCSTTNLALSTGVQFVRVPADWLDNDHASFGPYKTTCWWDICWEEMAYPLTRDFEGESQAMNTAWCVFIVLIAVYAFWISRPWW